MEVLPAIFTKPELLRPGQTTYRVTEEVALTRIEDMLVEALEHPLGSLPPVLPT